ncbi:phosphatidylinositol phospholipase C [Sugiyamaella lignohabitans]|uniref:Phosphoinositide phospholipase C n=1 Tax=Sugiyamaella lignohabitans TaxID=796027 RepID=A0A167DIP4_9ASCO|nr:phosphatidylinositol phospholipase C [Sugiyamaella lignohabitans]ANB12959.1 phosphatidylinositol phospholipase C [Sugiyamaella lignohabitans]
MDSPTSDSKAPNRPRGSPRHHVDDSLSIFQRVSNKVLSRFSGFSPPDPFLLLNHSSAHSSSSLPEVITGTEITSTRSNSSMKSTNGTKRDRSFSSSALSLASFRGHHSDDEFNLPPPGPVTIRRNSGLSRSSAESLISGNSVLASTPKSLSSTLDSLSIDESIATAFVVSGDIEAEQITASQTADVNMNEKNSDLPASNSPLSNNIVNSSVPSTDLSLPPPAGPGSVHIPELLQRGVSFLRITHRKRVQKIFVLDPESGVVSWDSKASSRFYVDRIFEVHVGHNARNYREELKVSVEHEPRWASIIYSKADSKKLKALHIVATSQKEFDIFIDILSQLVKYRREIMSGLAMPGEQFVHVHWNKFVTKEDDGEERLSFENVERLARRLHINCSKKYLESKFRQADIDESGFLDFKEFQNFVKLLKWRGDIAHIFNDIADNPNGLTLQGLEAFFRDVQKDTVTDSRTIEKIFKKHSMKGMKKQSGQDDVSSSDQPQVLTVEQFSDILVSSSYFPPLATPTEDLTRPLNEYLISSSHNTYLLARQVAGPSSVEAYIRALQNGCRCVEIDCWDGDHGPIVCHGHRLTTSIDFTDVVETIRKYGFISSPYPLILSLEIHCTVENQLKIVDALTNVLGSQLVTEPIDDRLELPCPADLKHRVLVKVKSTNSSFTANSKNGPHPPERADSSWSTTTTESSMSGISDDPSSTAVDATNGRSPSKGTSRRRKSTSNQTKVCSQLADLGVYLSGIKFRNFSLPISKTTNHCFSLSERSVNSMIKDPVKRAQLIKHNRKYLLRTYPSGYRMTSTNFDPIPYWKMGIQLVALNWQTNDIGLQLNHALFSNSGGYILKPTHMLLGFSRAEPLTNTNSVVSRSSKIQSKLLPFVKSSRSDSNLGSLITNLPLDMLVRVKITVISAQQLPRSKELKADETIDPYVTVEFYGNERMITSPSSSTAPSKRKLSISSTSSSDSFTGMFNKWRTPVVSDNGFNPTWNTTQQVEVDKKDFDFVFIRFTVHSGDTMFAVYTARLCNINQGYRHLQLQDLQGEEYIFSTLFIKTEIF